MKKYISILAVLSIAPMFALAQSAVDGEVDAELDQMYQAQTGKAVHQQPIYILNQAPNANSQANATQTQMPVQTTAQNVQVQPKLVINDTPLKESRTEQIRKARQDEELKTEERIVEKLEVSRMEDEKKRAATLFGDQFNQLNTLQTAPQAVAPVQQAQVVQAAPVAAPAENSRDMIREELRAALKAETDAPAAPVESKYFGGILGIGDYPDVRNVKGNYAVGASFGTKFDNTYAVEGTFLYSDYSLEKAGSSVYDPYTGIVYPTMIDVHQFGGSLAVKYMFLSGMVKPVFGGLVQYSYRTYNWNQSNYASSYLSQNQEATSHAIDVGVVTGADIDFNPKFSLGLDFRYMWNLSSRTNSNTNNSYIWNSGPQYGTPMEKLQYYTMSLVGRVNF